MQSRIPAANTETLGPSIVRSPTEHLKRLCVLSYVVLVTLLWLICVFVLGMYWVWSLFVAPLSAGFLLASTFPLLHRHCWSRWATQTLASCETTEDVVEFLKRSPRGIRPPAGDQHAMLCAFLFAITMAAVVYGGYFRWIGYRWGTDRELMLSDAATAFFIVLPVASLVIGILLAIPADYVLRRLFRNIPQEWVSRVELVQASPREICNEALAKHPELRGVTSKPTESSPQA